MPLFGRKKEPVEEDLVETESGWRPLQDVINEGWHSLAGAAWVFFQQHGRGAVMADFVSGDLNYAIADALRGDADLRREPLRQEVLALCQSYNPKKEVVLVTTVTRGRGEDRRLSDLVVVLKTPRGEMAPPEAAALMQRAEKTHQHWMDISERAFGHLPEELEKLRRKVDGRE